MACLIASCASDSLNSEIAELQQRVQDLQAQANTTTASTSSTPLNSDSDDLSRAVATTPTPPTSVLLDERPIATSPPAAPSSCDLATETLIESVGATFDDFEADPFGIDEDEVGGFLFDLSVVIGQKCGIAGAGDSFAEVLTFAARELETRPGDVKEAVRGFISGLCDPEGLQALDDLGVVIPQEGKAVCATADTESPCVKQWNRAYVEGATGSGSDRELRKTFTECSTYSEWNRNKNRVGGQSPSTLQAGCMLMASSSVCMDAKAKGVL
jgi:hypothetical protein